MATLILSEEVFQRIQRWAIPLVDNHDSVMTRILDAAERELKPPPVPDLNDSSLRRRSGTSSRRERTVKILARRGIWRSGVQLVLMGTDAASRSGGEPRATIFRARVGPDPLCRENVLWEHNAQAYSLSALTEKLRDHYGAPKSQGSLNGYLFWALADQPEKSLWELAEELRT